MTDITISPSDKIGGYPLEYQMQAAASEQHLQLRLVGDLNKATLLPPEVQ